jgi:hypothetical protein
MAKWWRLLRRTSDSKNYVEVGTSSSGTSSITLEEIETTTSTYDYECSVTVEAEVTAGGMSVGKSDGFSYGYSYSSSVSSGTYIEGEVPDIPEESYDYTYQFHWGLMAYPYSTDDQNFTVVSYWVDN